MQLSMDMVEVHPDGSLRVEALPAHRHPHANRFTTKVPARSRMCVHTFSAELCCRSACCSFWACRQWRCCRGITSTNTLDTVHLIVCLQSAAAHVAFGVTSPARQSSPTRRPASINRKSGKAANERPTRPSASQGGSHPGSRPESPQRHQDNEVDMDHEGEYDVTVTSTPVAPLALGQQEHIAAKAEDMDVTGA